MSKEIRITYETLFDMLRNEKTREELQKLEPSFYQDVLEYIKDKQALTQKSDSELFASMEKEKAQKQLENAKKHATKTKREPMYMNCRYVFFIACSFHGFSDLYKLCTLQRTPAIQFSFFP